MIAKGRLVFLPITVAAPLDALRLLVIAAGLGAVAVGCARPQARLFPPIDPPRDWPAPPDRPRIRLLGVISSSRDLKAGRTFGERMDAVLRGPRPPIRFSSPQGVAVRSSDLVAVADGDGGAVHILSLKDRTHRIVFGGGDERFGVPMGVAWADERLFVTDAKRHEIIELDEQGNHWTSFGSEFLVRPVGITYLPQRRELYIVDGGAHQVAVFSLEGRLLRRLGSRGTGPGEFNFPTQISNFSERLLIADSGNSRVQLLDLDGNRVHTFGRKGDAAGDFSLPKGVGWGRDGHVYVVDAHFENVQVFTETGQLLMAFGEEGSDPGEFSLPAGVAVDGQDRIWIADSGNRRLQVFVYLRPGASENG